MAANFVFKDTRFDFVFCYTDTFIPLNSTVTINGVTAKTNTVYTSGNGWNPGVSNLNQGVIGFNFSNTGFVFGDTFVIVTSAGNTTVSSYAPTPTPTPTSTITPTATVTPTPTPSSAPNYATQKAIFGYGTSSGGRQSMTNLVSSTGVVSTDTTGVGTARFTLAAAGYGTDKAIFGYGLTTANSSLTNLVSNTGVVATDTTGVGSARESLAATVYGNDKAMFGYGYTNTPVSITNLVSNTGVVSTDTTGVGTARFGLAAAKYGTSGTAIFAFGSNGTFQNVSNLVSNTGVVATDTAGVGTARSFLAAANYGTDKAIFNYGSTTGNTGGVFRRKNLVSNTGVVSFDDVNDIGTARFGLAAATYGGNKAIFGYGMNSSAQYISVTNLVDSSGNVAIDTAGVGTGRYYIAAAGYSLS